MAKKSNNKLIIGAAILLLILASYSGQETTTIAQTIENVSAVDAYELMQSNADIIIIDVRTPDEFNMGHLENAINIDFYSDTFEQDIDKLDKDKAYLIYCRSGKRSGKSHVIMDGLNFSEVYNVKGGMLSWNMAELPLV